MNKVLIKIQFMNYLWMLLIFEAWLFILNFILPILFGLITGRMNITSIVTNTIETAVYTLGFFLFFVTLINYSRGFKLGVQNSMSRSIIGRSMILSYSVIALLQTAFQSALEWGYLKPTTGRIANVYSVFYSNYFHNGSINFSVEIIVGYLFTLLIATSAFCLATFLNLFTKRFHKWIILGIVVLIGLFVWGNVFAATNSELFMTIWKYLILFIFKAVGRPLKIINESNGSFAVTNSPANPIILLITLVILNGVLILIGKYINNHIQVRKML